MNEMKRNPRKGTIEKTALFLKELHQKTKDDYVYIPLNDMLSIYHLNHSLQKILRNDKYILFKSAGKGKTSAYKWNVGEPNLKMVKVLLRKTADLTNKKRKINSEKQLSIPESPQIFERADFYILLKRIEAIESSITKLQMNGKPHKYFSLPKFHFPKIRFQSPITTKP